MLGVALIFILSLYTIFLYPIRKPAEVREAERRAERSDKYKLQMKKLWDVAQVSMKDKKSLRAEKALLTILKFDDKNAAAYNRLGILYAKEQNYDEAIECFEIAQSLDNNASSLHNVGLIYIETGAFEKAAMAFEQALELEEAIPSRHIALAKAYEKMGVRKKAIEELERAFALDQAVSTLRLILAIHEEAGDTEKVAELTARIEQKIADNTARREAESKLKKRDIRSVIRRPKKILYPKKTVSTSVSTRPVVTQPASSLTPSKPRSSTAIRPSSNHPVNGRKLVQ